MKHLVFNVWTDGRGEQWYGPSKILFPKEPSSQFGMWKLSKCMFTQHFPPPVGAWFQGSSWPASLRIHQLRVKRNKGRGSPRLLVKYHLISFVLEPWRILLNPSLNSVKGCYNYFIWNQCDSKRWNGSFEIVYFILFFFRYWIFNWGPHANQENTLLLNYIPHLWWVDRDSERGGKDCEGKRKR